MVLKCFKFAIDLASLTKNNLIINIMKNNIQNNSIKKKRINKIKNNKKLENKKWKKEKIKKNESIRKKPIRRKIIRITKRNVPPKRKLGKSSKKNNDSIKSIFNENSKKDLLNKTKKNYKGININIIPIKNLINIKKVK